MTRREALICLLLAGITLGIYWPVHLFDLVYYDDPLVLRNNPEVHAGLTWASLKWAWTAIVSANWHPVTNLSFLVVSQFFGTAAGPHHLANAIIHSVNAALLFLLLYRLTSSTWRSAAIAAIFAWHPLRVESVAWIIERKDVLCTFFFFLSLLAYAHFTQKNSSGKNATSAFHDRNFYLALVYFILALLSKPMAVTLPFVLLLLDFWPFFKMTGGHASTADLSGYVKPLAMDKPRLKILCLEKLPFFAITVVFCFVTYRVQHDHAAMTTWDDLGLDGRLANMVSSYFAYPVKLFWPANLAIIYPLAKDYDLTQVILKACLLLAVSIGCVTQLARRPWLAFGWFWYLGMAVPIIGLVQVGQQSMADRYTYLPLIGPVMAIVWTAAELGSKWRRGKIILAVTAILILPALAALTERQLSFWRNTLALFEHSLAVTRGSAYDYFVLGLGWEHAGDTNRAIVCYRVAKKLQPADMQNRQNLIHLLGQQGHLDAVAKEYRELLALDPDNFKSHLAFSRLLTIQGHMDEYRLQLQECVRLNPNCLEALNNLAWELTTDPRPEIRNGVRAVELAEHACQLTQDKNTLLIGTLAAAYAETGRFDEAIATAQNACDLAQKNGETTLLQKNQDLLERYRQHKTAAD